MDNFVDSHCHWDAQEFSTDSVSLMAQARKKGVCGFVIPAVEKNNWARVSALAHEVPGASYMLGIHPLYVQRAQANDLIDLKVAVQQALSDPQFLGIGEIGLDYFVEGLDRERQWHFYQAQLKLAAEFELPVVLHVRRSQDLILKGLRQITTVGGIAHAFNGSLQQAHQFVDRNFCLGFGGAMTFTRALQIRRLAHQLPLEAIVLETDAPDIAPEWINHQRNDSSHLPKIAQVLANLRNDSLASIALQTTRNVTRVLPRFLPVP
jgi:TatD DNase family protein